MKIGILTFTYSDNFGAMLQAYGLKRYLNQLVDNTILIPYAPPYLTGRHWLIPFIPYDSKKRVLKAALRGSLQNLKIINKLSVQKKNMKGFRQKYLVDHSKKIISFKQLKLLKIDTLILGSDQIWNPDITIGLKKEFFGHLANPYIKKIIAYAASLGRDTLDPIYDQEVKELLKSIDFISLREKAAIPYINSLSSKNAQFVCDPSFLLNTSDWIKTEAKSKMDKPFIFIYTTEKNTSLIKYVTDLSTKKNLPVVQVCSRYDSQFPNVNYVDYCAGPSEFLSYIHHAKYVISNSYHAIVFSIIYQKNFFAFSHSRLNSRIECLLSELRLTSRMIHSTDSIQNIDSPIQWKEVSHHQKDMVKQSKQFLYSSLFDKER